MEKPIVKIVTTYDREANEPELVDHIFVNDEEVFSVSELDEHVDSTDSGEALADALASMGLVEVQRLSCPRL